ncbi:tyrosine-type recombinase/integrase [Kocuria marina]|uniref:tyrosine-type recombinase/integrase n=1 Tax=Kocuria marina TaxID=223184 RepID=UPI0022E07AF4|nr:site-specific integrase [Kocuria marina]
MASIRERARKDGTITWAVLWREAETGKQTSRSMLTERDALELRDFLNANGQSFALAAQSAAQLRSTSPTVGATVAEHIGTLTSVTPGTRHRYRLLADRHITQTEIGGIPIDTLTRADVSRWLNDLPLATKSKKNVHSLLSAALGDAVRDDRIPTNVAHGIRFTKSNSRREPVFLTRTQVDVIAGAMREHYRPFVHFLAGTGLRWSEATALRIRDVDLTSERGTVHVTRAWKENGDGWVIGAPKTSRGRRTVVMPTALTTLVKEHAQKRGRDELLFTAYHGGRIWNGEFHKAVWQPALAKIGDQLPAVPRVHDLRHTHASWLIAAGVPLTVIQRRLGHESIKTTSDTYGHLADDADQAAAAALD